MILKADYKTIQMQMAKNINANGWVKTNISIIV